MAVAENVALVERLLQDIQNDTASTFTTAQISALDAALRKQYGYKKHPIDMRMRFGFGSKRYYAVFLVGPERRPKRRDYEMSSLGNALTLLMIAGVIALQLVFLFNAF
jgi:hypothetical protein